MVMKNIKGINEYELESLVHPYEGQVGQLSPTPHSLKSLNSILGKTDHTTSYSLSSELPVHGYQDDDQGFSRMQKLNKSGNLLIN
jgi:hypothetical protein